MNVIRHAGVIRPSLLELCAGAGGQALGLSKAGFVSAALIEIDSWACKTLRANFVEDRVLEADIAEVRGRDFLGIDLLTAGIPCPPFSVAGKQLGQRDERDLFPQALRILKESRPRALVIENVPGLMMPRFRDYRKSIDVRLGALGYLPQWAILNASDFGVPQLRPRTVLVALRPDDASYFRWPQPKRQPPLTVGETLGGLMGSNGWKLAQDWAAKANSIAPTLVGGSKKHGGPDLGPTRARQAWLSLGVDGRGIADKPPAPDFVGLPRLTVEMAALLQGFPTGWILEGGKTARYRQVGNAFPPPVALTIGKAMQRAWARRTEQEAGQQVLAV